MAEDDIKTFKNFLPRLLQEKIESQKKGYKIALKRRKDRGELKSVLPTLIQYSYWIELEDLTSETFSDFMMTFDDTKVKELATLKAIAFKYILER